MQSPIAIIPYDVLIGIFSIYTRELSGDPVVLTHVCRAWRYVARNTGTLWVEINLQTPARAMHNLELARSSPLNVLWFNQHYTPGVYRSVDDAEVAWIWPHAPRFAEFILSHSRHVVDSVFKILPQQLPELVNLVVLCLSVQSHVTPTRITQSMPHLQDIQLSGMALNGEDLLRIFRETPSLQKVELLSPWIMLPADGVTQEKETIILPHLRVFNITDVDTTIQRYLMIPLVFPPRCTIMVVRDSQNFRIGSILDSAILSRFRPLRFVELECKETILDFTEYPSDERASLRLVNRFEDIHHQYIDSALELSSLRKITFSGDISSPFLEDLLQHTWSVANIVIRKTRTAQRVLSIITSILRFRQDLLHNFDTLELWGIHFDAAILTSVEQLLEHCQDVGREVQTLLLRACRLDPDCDTISSLGKLVTEVRVV